MRAQRRNQGRCAGRGVHGSGLCEGCVDTGDVGEGLNYLLNEGEIREHLGGFAVKDHPGFINKRVNAMYGQERI